MPGDERAPELEGRLEAVNVGTVKLGGSAWVVPSLSKPSVRLRSVGAARFPSSTRNVFNLGPNAACERKSNVVE